MPCSNCATACVRRLTARSRRAPRGSRTPARPRSPPRSRPRRRVQPDATVAQQTQRLVRSLRSACPRPARSRPSPARRAPARPSTARPSPARRVPARRVRPPRAALQRLAARRKSLFSAPPEVLGAWWSAVAAQFRYLVTARCLLDIRRSTLTRVARDALVLHALDPTPGSLGNLDRQTRISDSSCRGRCRDRRHRRRRRPRCRCRSSWCRCRRPGRWRRRSGRGRRSAPWRACGWRCRRRCARW